MFHSEALVLLLPAVLPAGSHWSGVMKVPLAQTSLACPSSQRSEGRPFVTSQRATAANSYFFSTSKHVENAHKLTHVLSKRMKAVNKMLNMLFPAAPESFYSN